jgi:tRNA A37 methylthiotransferase MiaB
MAKRYLIETFGCQMNFHDSERMAGLLGEAGYEATATEDDADLIVINTCSVREHAEPVASPSRKGMPSARTRTVTSSTSCSARNG